MQDEGLKKPENNMGRRLWRLLLLAGLVVFVASFYGHVLKAPDEVVLSGNGDGLKNYYTLLWQANHDASPLQYTGSNQPFGESVFYTDGHAWLSWLLKLWPGLAKHAVGALNVLLLLGIVACGLCLHELLRLLGMAPWVAAFGAFSITVLQPQIFRITGHFSLAHAWFIPLFMLLAVRMHRPGAKVFPAMLWPVLAILMAYLTHAYMGLMGTMFLLAYGFSRWVLGGFTTPALKFFFTRTLPSAVVPMLVFLVLLWASDKAGERPAGPMGADKLATQVVDLIIPTHDPFKTPLRGYVNFDKLNWEAWCYLGLFPILALVIAGGLQLRRWSTRQPPEPVDEAGHLLAAGFPVLLFAMGAWQDLLGGAIPFLDQFRSLGRFAWPFFFASAVFATVRCYAWLVLPVNSRKLVAWPLFVGLVGFMAVEGWAYHRGLQWAVGRAPNPFRADSMDPDHLALVQAARASGAVAMMPQPWVHFGSERYDASAPEGVLGRMMPLAFHSGIPMLAGFTSRTSLRQTRMEFALLAPDYYPKALRRYLPDTARILLVRPGGPVSPREDSLWARATPLLGNSAGAMRMITAAKLTGDDRQARAAWYKAMRDSLPAHNGWRVSTALRQPPEDVAKKVYFGADSVVGRVNESQELLRLDPGALDTSVTYELNFRYRSTDPWAVNTYIVLVGSNPDGSEGRWADIRNLQSMPMQLDDGLLVCSFTFKPHAPGLRYALLLTGPEESDSPYSVRDVVLRPLGVDVWREGVWDGKGTVFLNGFPLTFSGPNAIPPSGN